MVKIRLARRGPKKKPFYRIVVQDAEAPRDGRFLEVVGTYDPLKNPAEVSLKTDRVDYWLGEGAIPTGTVSDILKKEKHRQLLHKSVTRILKFKGDEL